MSLATKITLRLDFEGETCPACDGEGRVLYFVDEILNPVPGEICSSCVGSGFILNKPQSKFVQWINNLPNP